MRAIILLICALFCILFCGCKERKSVDFVEPAPKNFYRTMFASVVHNGNAYIIGGWDGKAPLKNDVWRLSNRGEWEQICKSAPWKSRCYFSAESFNDYIYIFGGYAYVPPSMVYKDIWRSRDGITWEQCTNPPWEAREHYGVVVKNNSIILFGGVTYLDPPPGTTLRAFSDVWKFNDENWTLINTRAPWGERRGFSYGVLGDFIYLWGGWDSYNNLYNDVWRSRDGTTWKRVTGNAPWCPRGNCHGCVFENRLWIFGGCVDDKVTACSGVWSSDDGVIWTEHEKPPWDSRAGVHPIIIDDTLLIISGFQYQPNKIFYQDIWKFRKGGWTKI